MNFILITAAYNASSTLERTIRSVIAQKVEPSRWIIVDDGSTDRTADIVREFSLHYSFIELLQQTKDNAAEHSLCSKARALNRAVSCLDLRQVDFIGILDSDVELPEKYFLTLFMRMEQNSKLGIAGGAIRPFYNGAFHDRIQNSRWSVAGAVQMFKTSCFLDVGGRFLEMPYGGVDAAIEIMARSKGWTIRTFEDLQVIHYGPVGAASGSYLKTRYRRGVAFASLGYHPVFHFLRCVARFREFPWVVGSLYEMVGYLVGRCKYPDTLLDKKTVNFLRREQINRLFCIRRS